jgi:glutathione peroxidase-family protein
MTHGAPLAPSHLHQLPLTYIFQRNPTYSKKGIILHTPLKQWQRQKGNFGGSNVKNNCQLTFDATFVFFKHLINGIGTVCTGSGVKIRHIYKTYTHKTYTLETYT